MHLHHLNLLAILVAAISTMVVGFLWYSRFLFAIPWMREMGYDPNDKAKVQEMQKSAGPAYLGSFIASLVSAFVLALFFHWLRVQDLEFGLLVSSHVWLGFVATVQLTSSLFSKQSMKLFAINTGYQLACYLAMGAILTVWK
jgi:fluoride ion exporter CrcB/FEX